MLGNALEIYYIYIWQKLALLSIFAQNEESQDDLYNFTQLSSYVNLFDSLGSIIGHYYTVQHIKREKVGSLLHMRKRTNIYLYII